MKEKSERGLKVYNLPEQLFPLDGCSRWKIICCDKRVLLNHRSQSAFSEKIWTGLFNNTPHGSLMFNKLYLTTAVHKCEYRKSRIVNRKRERSGEKLLISLPGEGTGDPPSARTPPDAISTRPNLPQTTRFPSP